MSAARRRSSVAGSVIPGVSPARALLRAARSAGRADVDGLTDERLKSGNRFCDPVAPGRSQVPRRQTSLGTTQSSADCVSWYGAYEQARPGRSPYEKTRLRRYRHTGSGPEAFRAASSSGLRDIRTNHLRLLTSTRPSIGPFDTPRPRASRHNTGVDRHGPEHGKNAEATVPLTPAHRGNGTSSASK